MSKQLVDSINRYRELHTSLDWDNFHREDAESLAASAWYLIQELAREVVLRAERRGELRS
jgi:hypothetical protein